MKTIKDAIQASSIEQRRRILNNLGIDKDSKNFIVKGEAGKANEGGSDLNNFEYGYRPVEQYWEIETDVEDITLEDYISKISALFSTLISTPIYRIYLYYYSDDRQIRYYNEASAVIGMQMANISNITKKGIPILAFQESYVNAANLYSSSLGIDIPEDIKHEFIGIKGAFKFIHYLEHGNINISDDEIIQNLHEMFLIKPITKETWDNRTKGASNYKPIM
jgi:hypothetical protein